MPADESSEASTGQARTSGEPGDVGALIDLVLKRFHEAHRRQGPELSRAAQRLEREHAEDANWPKGLAALIERINGRLAAHMAKEEIVVFPRMRRGGGAPLDRPLAVLHAEHEDLERDMGALKEMSNAFTAPHSASAEWRELYGALAKFADDLAEHTKLEDEVLFPGFEAHPT
jgi:regulator of cell morphogenesis and NO signaling